MLKYFIVLILTLTISLQLTAQQQDTTNSDEMNNFEVEPKVLNRVTPNFPALASDAGLEETIWVKIALDKDGIPYKTEIIKRDPEFVYIFDDEVRRSAMQWRFSPALDREGKPVKVWITIPFRFKMPDYKPPTLTKRAVPECPQEAIDMGMEGWIGVGVLVNKDGTTLGNGRVVIVSREYPYTKLFDDAAIQAARRSEYKPATVNSNAVLGWLFYKIEIKLPQK
jgi:TonB family protein